MSGLVQKFISVAGSQYKKMVGKRLANYGLKLEDLYVETADVEKALHRIDHDTLVEREKRIKRAFDISAKKKLIPEELQDKNVFDFYLNEHEQLAKREREERAILNNYK